VNRLIEKLAGTGVRIGTVDKFQGQEAPVVIYTMATSRPEDAPRGMSFGDDHRSPAVLDPGNMPTHLLRNAVRIVEANQDQFITAWRNIHGA